MCIRNMPFKTTPPRVLTGVVALCTHTHAHVVDFVSPTLPQLIANCCQERALLHCMGHRGELKRAAPPHDALMGHHSSFNLITYLKLHAPADCNSWRHHPDLRVCAHDRAPPGHMHARPSDRSHELGSWCSTNMLARARTSGLFCCSQLLLRPPPSHTCMYGISVDCLGCTICDEADAAKYPHGVGGVEARTINCACARASDTNVLQPWPNTGHAHLASCA
jgi:hypothetical protein